MAPPLVLILGQYSTGKTTMMEYLIGRAVPGSHTGPEPTTDKFTAVTFGEHEQTIPGHAACSDTDLPYTSLQSYGSTFLGKFEVSQVPSDLLRNLTLLDTPGVLSGEKQRVNRGYDFAAVTRHLAERADRVILLFDCSKLDISDEFKEVVRSLDGQHDKVRCLLNKADVVDPDELFRVYGALLWSLGKVVNTPEVLRVFVASMWDKPYQDRSDARNYALFDKEKASLLDDLHALPQHTQVRRINETLKRWRAVRTHAMLCSQLASQFGMMGREKKQLQLLLHMEKTYTSLSQKHGLNAADFMRPENFARVIDAMDLKMWQWAPVSDSELAEVDARVNECVRSILSVVNADDTAEAEQISPRAGRVAELEAGSNSPA